LVEWRNRIASGRERRRAFGRAISTGQDWRPSKSNLGRR
jgi:hypothetical protein